MKLRWIVLFAGLLAACDNGTEAPPAKPPGPEAAPPPEKKAPDVRFDAQTLQKEAEAVALVPSPAEMQRALSNAGLSTKLDGLVGDRDIKMDVDNKDQIAVRTGVVLADLVLTVTNAPKEKMLARLGRLKEGFDKLGAGTDVQATVDDIIARVNNDAVSREDLLKEMDELSGVMVPELQYEAGDWVVPLIQAGSWLEGAHLVSGAVKTEGKFDAAGPLLRQPAVVDYFLKYVRREGREKAPDEVVTQLEQTLQTLKEVTSHEKLTEEDVSTINSATGAVLTLL